MHAIVLAAGRPSFGDAPLPALEICGTGLLDIQLEALRTAGVDEATVVIGHRADEVATGSASPIVNPDWETGGSLSSLARAAGLFDGRSDVLVHYGDCLYAPASIRQVLNAPGDVVALCSLDAADGAHEMARIGDGTVASVGSTASPESLSAVFTGLVLVRQRKAHIIRRLLEQKGADGTAHLGGLLHALAEAGLDVAPIFVRDGWVELDDPARIAQAEALVQKSGMTVPLRTDWGARARAYDQLDWVSNDRLLDVMVERARGFAPRRVLDVGTGTGKILRGLRDRGVGTEFWGVDTSQDMLDRVQDPQSYTLHVDSAETLDTVPRDRFDLVTARMVYHHIGDTVLAARTAREVLRPGGHIIICEGVPPSSRTVDWYTEMFRYKEDRNTLTEGDIIAILDRAGFTDIHVDVVVMPNASLNNWLDKSGIPDTNIRTIKQMHYEAPDFVREDYDMVMTDTDCLMTWRFAIVSAVAPA